MSDEQTPAAQAAKTVRKKAAVKKTEASEAVNALGEKVAATARKASPKKPVTDLVVATAEDISEQATDAADTASTKAAGVLSAATDKVTAMIPENMGLKAKEVASDVKDKASDAVEGLAKIIHDSAGAIDDNVGPKYGDYARSAAQSVTDAADRLRAKPVDEIAEDTKEFVRTKPGTAIGIAAVASLVLAKILGAVFGKRR